MLDILVLLLYTFICQICQRGSMCQFNAAITTFVENFDNIWFTKLKEGKSNKNKLVTRSEDINTRSSCDRADTFLLLLVNCLSIGFIFLQTVSVLTYRASPLKLLDRIPLQSVRFHGQARCLHPLDSSRIWCHLCGTMWFGEVSVTHWP